MTTDKKIVSKFRGECRVCGKPIAVGSEVYWAKDAGARHVGCQPVVIPPDAIRIGGGSGYGCQGWTAGQVVRNGKAGVAKGQPEFLYILQAERRYVREDGLSFGVGDEQGYIYSGVCRAATDEESQPLRDRSAAKAKREEAARALQELVAQFRRPEHSPPDQPEPYRPEGERLNIGKGQDIYGGGEWFVVGPEWIWYVLNNGTDGGDWRGNNVATGGAGAIGWRRPFDPELAATIRSLLDAGRAAP